MEVLQPKLEMVENQIKKTEAKKKLEPISTLIPEFNKPMELNEFVEIAKARNQVNVVEREKEKMSNILHNVMDDFDEIVNQLKEKGVTTEQIAAMTAEEIDALYTTADGGELALNAQFSTKEEEIEFKRDFLDMLLENSVRFEEIDKHLAELDKDIKNFDQGIAQIYNETNGDIMAFVRKELEQAIARDPESDEAKGSKDIIKAIEDSYDLNSLYDYCVAQKIPNIVSDFKYRKDDVYGRFVKNCKRTQIITNYKNYDNVEVNFLGEKFWEHPGLFAFLIVRMFSYKKQFTRLESIWLLQVNANLNLLMVEPTRGLVLNDVQRENRDRLIKGMERVLELFITPTA